MKFQEAYNLVDSLLFESNPLAVAAKIRHKSNNFSQYTNNEFILLYNQITNNINNNKLPTGNGSFINIKNDKQIDDYIQTIKNNLNIIKDENAKEAAINSLKDLKNKIVSKRT